MSSGCDDHQGSPPAVIGAIGPRENVDVASALWKFDADYSAATQRGIAVGGTLHVLGGPFSKVTQVVVVSITYDGKVVLRHEPGGRTATMPLQLLSRLVDAAGRQTGHAHPWRIEWGEA